MATKQIELKIKIKTQVAAWVRHCENSLDFLFRDDTPDLGVVEALQGPPHLKICDPISGLDEPHVMKKVVSANIKIKIMMRCACKWYLLMKSTFVWEGGCVSNTLPRVCIRKYSP